MSNTPIIKSGLRLWISDEGGTLLGSDMIQLLEHIDKAGSVKNGAIEMGISYTKATKSLLQVETQLGHPLLDRNKHGSKINGTARELIHRYNRFAADCHPVADVARERYFKDFKFLPFSGSKGNYESDGISVSFKTDIADTQINGLHPRIKPWVSIDGAIIGMGIAELFENIIKVGSILNASYEMNMSFSKAYVLIRALRKTLGHELVHPQMGGSPKLMGAYLTESGFDIYNRYKAYVVDCREWVCESFLLCFKDFISFNTPVEVNNDEKLKLRLLDELQKYLLMHGSISPGMAFYARNQTITIAEKENVVDLVYCNTIAQCFFLICVVDGNPAVQKTRQVEKYVKHFDDNVRFSGDNPTIGLTIYVDENGATAEYAMPNGSIRLFNEKYKKVFPAIDTINRKLTIWFRLLKNEQAFDNQAFSQELGVGN